MTRWVDSTAALEVVTPDGTEIIRVVKNGVSKGIRSGDIADADAAAAIAAHVAAADPHTQYLTEVAAAAGYQPLDSDLTAIAALSTTAFGRSVLDRANAAALATLAGVGTDDSPQFTAVNLGHASDTTVARSAAGRIAVEGVDLALDTFLSGTGAITRTIEEKLRDAKSVLDFIPKALHASIADGTNTTLLDSYITLAKTASNSLIWPYGTYLVAGPITNTAAVTWVGYGATIKQSHTARGYVLPLLINGAGSEGSSFEGITFNHNAVGVAEPALAAATAYAYLCCILTWDDDVVYTNCVALNAWDSGFTSGTTNVTGTGAGGDPITVSSIPAGEPQRVRFINCRAYNCGVGVHTLDSNQQVGGGFNVLNGSRTVVADCVAFECSTGFIADFGSSSGATFSSCVAASSKYSSGWGFWLGSGPINVANCSALYCGADGFVVAPQANGVTLSGTYAFACGEHGYVLASAKFSCIGCVAQDNSQDTSNTYSAFYVDSGTEAITDAVFSGCIAIGSTHKYGLEATGANTITGQWIGGSLNGATAAYSVGTKSVSVMVQKTGTRNVGFNVDAPDGRLAVAGTVTSYAVTPVGDTGNGGAFQVVEEATPAKKIAVAYDNTNDSGVIQAIHTGTTVKPLLLNPSGGAVSVGAALIPVTSDGGALGSTAKMWSDLFLASGGVINWNSGNVTATHSAGIITLSGSSNAKLVVQGTSGAESLNVNATGGSKFFTVKPETSTDTAQIGYWTGAAFGTLLVGGTLSPTNLTVTNTPRINVAASSVGTGTKTISNAADSSTNFGKYFTLNLNGTTVYVPCSTVAPT